MVQKNERERVGEPQKMRESDMLMGSEEELSGPSHASSLSFSARVTSK